MCSLCEEEFNRCFLRSITLSKLSWIVWRELIWNNVEVSLDSPEEKCIQHRFYFKIIYLHIIGMKTGWYICDGTGQFPYRNIQSIQKPLFQTWTKWINILVNKYISDMSLYWNVLLYIKYNTISFLFLLFSFYTQSIQNILTYPLKFWRDLYS